MMMLVEFFNVLVNVVVLVLGIVRIISFFF